MKKYKYIVILMITIISVVGLTYNIKKQQENTIKGDIKNE